MTLMNLILRKEARAVPNRVVEPKPETMAMPAARAVNPAAVQKIPALVRDQAPIRDQVRVLYSLTIKSVISDLPADTSSTTEDITRMAGDILRLPLRT